MPVIVDEGAELYTLFASPAADGICAASQWTQRRRRNSEEWSSIQKGVLTK